MKRKIRYLTGSRADFGLIRSTLLLAQADARLEVDLIVTGQHLDPDTGLTITDVQASGLTIAERIDARFPGGDGGAMARTLGTIVIEMTAALEKDRPDALLLLGDRGEMLAGAIAAIHLNIPVFHVHGGERSGTIDESLRHAISKLAHYHLTSTQSARERLIRMGERASSVFVTGAPGIDGLAVRPEVTRESVFGPLGLDPSRPLALVVFHPVVQDAQSAGAEFSSVMDAVQHAGLQALCLAPNSDAGHGHIRGVLQQRSRDPGLRVLTHLARDEYLRWMQVADVMVGNSSSGIIESATFDLPVVNVGRRQQARERPENVVDCEATAAEISAAIGRALAFKGRRFTNPYGDGKAGQRIVELLATLPLHTKLLSKLNSY